MAVPPSNVVQEVLTMAQWEKTLELLWTDFKKWVGKKLEESRK